MQKNFLNWPRCIVLISILIPSSILAQSEQDSYLSKTIINPQTLKHKILQAETGYQFILKGESDYNQNSAQILVRYGLYKRLEFFISSTTSFLANKPENENETNVIQEGSGGLKLNIMRSRKKFSLWSPGISLIGGSTYKTSEDNIYAPFGGLAISWYFTKIFKMEANGLYFYQEEEKKKYNQFITGVCFKLFLRKWTVHIGHYNKMPGTYNGEYEYIAEAGFIYFFSDIISFFLKTGRGIYGNNETCFAFGSSFLLKNMY